MVDEDNDNRQWGHSHYKSGINNTLLTWGSVGSVGVAFQLLAAGLRISACTRHICYKRRIHIPADSTLIADVYLERLTNRLVHVWQKADGVCIFFSPLFLPSSDLSRSLWEDSRHRLLLHHFSLSLPVSLSLLLLVDPRFRFSPPNHLDLMGWGTF